MVTIEFQTQLQNKLLQFGGVDEVFIEAFRLLVHHGKKLSIGNRQRREGVNILACLQELDILAINQGDLGNAWVLHLQLMKDP